MGYVIKMKRKLTLSITLSLLFIFVLSGISTMISVSANDSMDLQPYDAGTALRKTNYQMESEEHHRHRELIGKAEVGTLLDWAILDDWLGGYFWATYELRAVGEVSEIWVQVDLSYPDDDPRDDPVIEDEQVDYLLDEFEGNIYPVDTEYFGMPDEHKGTKPTLGGNDWKEPHGRSVILVSNVRDEAYYNSSYPYYIAGFYSPTFEQFFDRNIISIDSHNWEDRIGPDANRPYLYEAIIAHEYQHLIHDDYNGADDIFMNEGCSMYAEPLCGYPLAWGDIDSFLATPDNSLTTWGDQGGINILADYGSSLMFAIYLGDHYGDGFLSHFVQAGIPGVEGINAALEFFGFEDTFETIFHDWRIANLIDSGDYFYNFMDLTDTAPPRIYDLNSESVFPFNGVDFGETISILNYSTGVYKLGSYSTDYIKLTGLNDYTFEFNGDDLGIAAEWEINGEVLYSTPAWSECDLSIRTDLDLTNVVGAYLTFDTMYEIELDWDFGFTQISTDNGETWVSLENNYTTGEFDPNAHPNIVENLPGLCGNETVDWISMGFDLSAYDGQEVILQFRYMTDWAYEELGWWITNVAINDVGIDVGAFYNPPPPETDFLISFIGDEGFVYDMNLNDADETGAFDLWTIFPDDEYILMVVSATFGNVDYTLDFVQNIM